MSTFKKLKIINLNDYISKRTSGKQELSYVSWADAFDTLFSIFEDKDVSYTIFENPNRDNLPIFGSSEIGYFVKTSVTIIGDTKYMMLPVLDGSNKSLKDTPYTYNTKFSEKYVEAINVFDINKSILRCLVKNIAAFGLGLYVYRGEDFPNIGDEDVNLSSGIEPIPEIKKPIEKPKSPAKKVEKEQPKGVDINYIKKLMTDKADLLSEQYTETFNKRLAEGDNDKLLKIQNYLEDLGK